MGCFSYLSLKSGLAAVSTSFDGSPCWLFKLHNGKVVEYMHGNYDSYGRVFDGKGGRFEWKMRELPTAMLLDHEWKEGDPFPTTESEGDPDQGWGSDWPYLKSTGDGIFEKVQEPKHVVFEDILLEAKVSKIDKEIEWLYQTKDYTEKRLARSKKDGFDNKYVKDFTDLINQCIEDFKKLKKEKEELLNGN